MNVWIINHYAVSPAQSGGTRHFSFARALVERGHDVTIIASSFDHTTRTEMHLKPGERAKIELIDGVKFLWLRTPPYEGNNIRRIRNMVSFAWRVLQLGPKQLRGKPDVILGSSPHLFAAWAAERLAKRYRVPFVFEVRDLWPQSLIDLGSFSDNHPFIRALERLERYLYRRACRIVTLLPAAAEHIIAKGADPDRIIWIPNGVDLSLVPDPTPVKEKPIIEFMYAGTHGLANGLDVILDAAKILQEQFSELPVKFRLIGDGPEKPRLIKRAREMNLENINFEPPVPKKQVYEILRQADAFLMLLEDSPVFRWGVSPNKLFDYMAAARPIIFAVNTPVNPVQEAGAGFVVRAGDPKSLVNAIVNFASLDLDTRRTMGQRARQYVERYHDIRRLTDKLERVLEDAKKSCS